VVNVACGVDGSKTPGYPLNLFYGTNGQALESEFDLIVDAAVARLHMWLSDSSEGLFEGSSYSLVASGIVDPSTIFIKDEPHPARKVRDKRYRCITPVSLVDQLVEAVLFGDMAEYLKAALFRSGSAVGIGFSDAQMDDLREFVREKLIELRGHMLSDDVSGFDAMHTEQMLLATCDLDELRFVGTHPCTKLWRANRRWAKVSSRSVSVFGSVLMTKVIPGMINSGSRDTSRRNTSLRLIYGHLILTSMGTEGFVLANGDDCVTIAKSLDGYEQHAGKYGIKVRDVLKSDEEFEFCSHRYRLDSVGAPLTSWPKSIFRMLSLAELDPWDVRQSLGEMRWNANFAELQTFVETIAPMA
jgi:hypothetical protein